MLPLTISYNYEIVYHRQKERESLKSPFPCCFDRFFSFLHFLMAYFSTKSEYKKGAIWRPLLLIAPVTVISYTEAVNKAFCF